MVIGGWAKLEEVNIKLFIINSLHIKLFVLQADGMKSRLH
jgi:hypothetical protein